jgi:hypothetical protein
MGHEFPVSMCATMQVAVSAPTPAGLIMAGTAPGHLMNPGGRKMLGSWTSGQCTFREIRCGRIRSWNSYCRCTGVDVNGMPTGCQYVRELCGTG